MEGAPMDGRRKFIKKVMASTAILGVWLQPLFKLVSSAYAQTQTLFAESKSSDRTNESLTPLAQFKTMGITRYEVDIQDWRLAISGNVKNPLRLTYDQLLEFPAYEKKVTLVCPGFFENHGRWKGVSMRPLLEKASMAENAKQVIIWGHNGTLTKKEQFPIEDILSNKVFFAHTVNGVPLPEKHGYPLRVVAEGYQGDDWVKYVYEMKVV
jgi:sulfoxide reductase catalytic subunit YedY